MANVYTPGFPDPSLTPKPVPSVYRGGRVRTLLSDAQIANGQASADVVWFGKIPSNARLLPQSSLEHDAISLLTDFDVGVLGGSVNLMDALALTSAGSKGLTVAIENLVKPLWELAGLTADPGGELTIIGTLNATTGAAGDILLSLQYVTD